MSYSRVFEIADIVFILFLVHLKETCIAPVHAAYEDVVMLQAMALESPLFRKDYRLWRVYIPPSSYYRDQGDRLRVLIDALKQVRSVIAGGKYGID